MNIETILQYVNAGMSVVPIPLNQKYPGMIWKEFQNRLASEQEIRAWFSAPCNIGIVTGSISNLLVVDLDAQKGLEFGAKNHILSCVTVLSGRGRHLWFQNEPELKTSQNKELGVDVRGEGGLVLVPPSIHLLGSMYRFLTDAPFQNRPKMSRETLQILKKTQEIQQSVKEGREEGWISKLLEDNMSEGKRHLTYLSVLGRLRRDCYSKDDARRFLQYDAQRTGSLEILSEMLDKVWNSYTAVQKIDDSAYRCKSPQNAEDLKEYEESKQLDRKKTIRTGFPTLDRLCATGIKSERLFTIAARTGTGKTNFAINLARKMCENGNRVLYFSTEFTYKKVWDWFKESMPNPERFSEYSFAVCDGFSPSIEKVEELIKKEMPDVFIFDHINHIAEENEFLSKFMQGCNRIQRMCDSQGVMIAQLNRLADWTGPNGERVEPRMSMIKGSGTIEQASSRVLLLSETKVTPEYNEILAVLDKNDDGDKSVFHLALRKNPYRMEEL